MTSPDDISKPASNPLAEALEIAIQKENQNVLMALGDLTCKFSLMQFALDELLRAMVRISPQEAQALLGNITAGALVERIKAIGRATLTPTQWAELGLILDRAGKLNARRNEIVHALWSLGYSDLLVFAYERHSLIPVQHKSDNISVLNQELVQTAIDLLNARKHFQLPAPPPPPVPPATAKS